MTYLSPNQKSIPNSKCSGIFSTCLSWLLSSIWLLWSLPPLNKVSLIFDSWDTSPPLIFHIVLWPLSPSLLCWPLFLSDFVKYLHSSTYFYGWSIISVYVLDQFKPEKFYYQKTPGWAGNRCLQWMGGDPGSCHGGSLAVKWRTGGRGCALDGSRWGHKSYAQSFSHPF